MNLKQRGWARAPAKCQEVTLFCRSATLGQNSCSLPQFLWHDNIDGKLCGALNQAFLEWAGAHSHSLVMPTGAELRAARDKARRAAQEANPPARTKANKSLDVD